MLNTSKNSKRAHCEDMKTFTINRDSLNIRSLLPLNLKVCGPASQRI